MKVIEVIVKEKEERGITMIKKVIATIKQMFSSSKHKSCDHVDETLEFKNREEQKIKTIIKPEPPKNSSRCSSPIQSKPTQYESPFSKLP